MAESNKGDLSRSTQSKPDAGNQSAPATKPVTEIYYVRGPGSIARSIVVGRVQQRVLIPAGELIELTAEEAAGYGDAVVMGTPPPPPADVSKRAAGEYVVRGPGRVKFGKEWHAKGARLRLTEEDARSLGSAVVEA